MFGKKEPPRVRIPASILKREAQKIAKKMAETDRKKEVKENLKLQAEKKAEKKRQNQEDWSEFFTVSLQRELWGVLWIVFSVALAAFFFSDAPVSVWSLDMLKSLFGIGTFVIPIFCMGIGIFILIKRESVFPPQRMAAFFFFFASILGLTMLFVPQEESLDRAKDFGGALGFSLSYFPREFFGNFVAGVLLIGIFWITGMLAFGIKFSEIFGQKKEEKQKTKMIPERKMEMEDGKEEKKLHSRFKNDLEIIDTNVRRSKKGKGATEREEDELTQAKNRSLIGIWEPPSPDILKSNVSTIVVDEDSLRKKADIIREKLEQFGIEVTMKSVHVGPTVTQFTLEPAAGVKLTKITALKNDLALALAAQNLRIEAPIPGKSLVGIEIPNDNRSIVGMREILESETWEKEKSALKLAFGRDVAGRPFVTDLAKMPHLLIAGKTGSGKSVAMNAFLCSLLWNNPPDRLKLILVDPKRVELSLYNHLPHLLTPVITEPEKCVSALAWAVAEMNRRYKMFSQEKCRNINEYNEKFPDKREPFIVIVIDELADLMMVAGRDVEAAICRIAQMARAVGMHLLVATQRPSVDVVTGLIKANLSARVAFKVSSGIDSRTILDGIGAEDLLGFGDMLYLDGNNGYISRIQGLLISNEEVERVTNHIKLQFPEMIANDEITRQSIEGMAKGGVLTVGTGDETINDKNVDDLFQDAVVAVLETKKASASFLQRRLEVGYARAARLLDQMEARGIIGPSRGAKAREVYGRKNENEYNKNSY